MSSPYLSTLLALSLYLLSTILGICGLVFHSQRLMKWGVGSGILAFFAQTILLILGFHKLFPAGPASGAYLQLLAWFILLCGIIAWLRLKTGLLILFAAPLGLLLFILSLGGLETSLTLPEFLTAPFYALHIGSLYLSLGLFALAAIAGALFLFLQKILKNKKRLKALPQSLPPLALLDQLNAICVMAGFPLYTLGLFTGFIWAQSVFGQVVSLDPKEILSLCVWLLLAILFHNRLAKGWTGRKPALFALIIFLLCLFSILILNFYFPTHHAFFRN